MQKITMTAQWDDAELYVMEGTNKAVKIIMGYSTGSDIGMHCFLDSFVMAQLGTVDDNGMFVEDLWTEEDFGKNIFTKSLIGTPKEARGWNPPDDDGDVNWGIYSEWVDDVCEELLRRIP